MCDPLLFAPMKVPEVWTDEFKIANYFTVLFLKQHKWTIIIKLRMKTQLSLYSVTGRLLAPGVTINFGKCANKTCLIPEKGQKIQLNHKYDRQLG